MKNIFLIGLIIFVFFIFACRIGNNNNNPSSMSAGHNAVEEFDTIPATVISTVSDLYIYYGHTSHGSQLISGINQFESSYWLNNLTETGTDLGNSDWHTITRDYLNSHQETDVVIWSWCGQQAENSIETVQNYLDNMTQLEQEFPDVIFIYMTGHLRGAYTEYLYTDEQNEVLQRNNNMVVDYCTDNEKWLFDFADIESYHDGETEQCTYHDMPCECLWPTDETGCVHSRLPNCIRKGKAFYWLLAKITGWTG